MRHAVIDIGTNTLLLLIAERGADGTIRPILDECRFGRLGQGLDGSGKLADEAIERSLVICREYRALLDANGAPALTVIGTAALREAKNAASFVGPAEAVLGAPIEVIAGEREAELALAGVVEALPDVMAAPCLVVDVGGGSTELISWSGTAITSAVSLPIGAVKLRERHLSHDPPSRDDRANLINDVDARLARLQLPRNVPVVATAGTATTLAAIELGLTDYAADAVTGLRLAPAKVDALVSRLMALTIVARRELPGMVAERADVLPAGASIFARILERVGSPVMIVCDRGIRWGMMAAKLGR